jgi:hypothetical protein
MLIHSTTTLIGDGSWYFNYLLILLLFSTGLLRYQSTKSGEEMTSLKDPHERWTEGYVLHHLFFGVDSAIFACEDWVASMFHTGSN